MKFAGVAVLALVRVALLQVAVAPAAQCDISDPEKAARLAVAAHQYAEARELYRKFADEHPVDAESRIWIGRLSGYLADFPAALAAYDAALALAPKNIDALVGKAYILLWTRQYHEAAALLSQVREIAPDSADVNLATARQYVYTRRPDLARGYVDRVLAADPANSDAQSILDTIAPPGSLRLDLSVATEDLPYAPTGVSGAFEIGWSSSTNDASLRIEDWSRYGENVFRGGLHYGHTFNYHWIVEGSFLAGSRGDVLARWDNAVGVKRKFRSGWVAGMQYRQLLFDSAHINLFSPQAEYYFERPIWLDASYSRSGSSFKSAPDLGSLDAPANSFLVRYHQGVHRLTFQAGFGRGLELFSTPTPDSLGRFTATVLLAGLDIPVVKPWSMHFGYVQERRSNGTVDQIVTAGVTLKRSHEP